MNKLELMKTANEVRKGVITATHRQTRSARVSSQPPTARSPVIRADLCQQQIFLPIFILKK